MNVYDRAFDYLIGDEGSKYTNSPVDSGGPTKWGITLRAYLSYAGRPVGPKDIENLSKSDAKVFFFDRYWRPLGCAGIRQEGPAIAIFDSGVLYGVAVAAFYAQEALQDCSKTVKVDGFIGDSTVTALNEVKADEFLWQFHLGLLKRIDSVCRMNPKNEKWRHGWTNRANRLLTLGTSDPLNKENPNPEVP